MTQKTTKPTNKKLRQTILDIRNKTYPYKNKQLKKIDFTKYNLAQINEITDVLQSIRNIVDLADQRIQQRDPPQKGPGRPKAPPKDVVKVQLLETYFGISDRVAEGFFNLFREKLGISSEFCYKTIERGYDPERSDELVEEILKITNEIGNAHETKFSIDGTGDPCTSKVNYESKRSQQRAKKQTKSNNKPVENTNKPIDNRGDNKAGGVDCFAGRRHDFQYCVFTVGVTTKIIGGFATSDDHHRGELSFFQEVVEQTVANCPCFDVLLGDGLYANRVVCGLLEQQELTAYFLPRSNVTFKSRGVALWKRMLYGLVLNPQLWLESYHDRSISESANSMLKRREPAKIRKKLSPRKGVAEAFKVLVHNIRQICYLKYLNPQMLNTEIYVK